MFYLTFNCGAPPPLVPCSSFSHMQERRVSSTWCPPPLILPLLFSFLLLHQVAQSRYRSPVHVGNSSFQAGLSIWETAKVWDAMIEAPKVFNRVLIQFVCSVLSSSALTHKKKTSSFLSLSVRSSSILSAPERPRPHALPLKWCYILLRQKSWAWKCLFISACIGSGTVSCSGGTQAADRTLNGLDVSLDSRPNCSSICSLHIHHPGKGQAVVVANNRQAGVKINK